MRIKIAVGAVLLSAIGAPVAMATNIQVGYSGAGYGPWQTGQGGEFTLTPYDVNPNTPVSQISGRSLDYSLTTSSQGIAGSFQTFCIEENEYIYPYGYSGRTVAVGTLSDTAQFGGIGGTKVTVNGVTSDALSIGTAWLYKQFAEGKLVGYSYSVNGRLTSADQLQRALWWLEGEAVDPNNIFSQAVVANFGSVGAAMADNNGAIGVKVLNLKYYNANGTFEAGQDQLVSVPDGGTTCAFLGIALAGMGLIRRKIS